MAKLLDVSELDFDNIKAKLIKFMSSQDEFVDYDFTGSAMNVLLDVLAYNTAYLGIYTNMSISESFMSSAILRNNVVRRAKEMNYFPKQLTSSNATLSLSIDIPADPASVTVDKGTKFQAGGYTFLTTVATPLTKNGTIFTGDIIVTEGQLITETYEYNKEDRIRVLLNTGVDTDFLIVSLGGAKWDLGNDQQLGDEDKPFYFLSEEDDRGIGLYFGDDIISKEPDDQAVITTEYLKCAGSVANGQRTFSNPATIGGYASSLYTVTVSSISQNGTDGNTIANIQLAAPKYYQAQGRAVTTKDYEAIIHSKVPGVQSVSVWAGEDNIPKRPGSVYMAIKPQINNVMTPLQKTNALTILDDYNVVGILPVIVDPIIMYVSATASLNYSKDKVISNTNITSVGLNAMKSYFDNIDSNFGSDLLYSKLVGTIDDSSDDIINSNVTYTVAQKILLQNTTTTATIDYNNAIEPGTISSNAWAAGNGTLQIKDDGEGVVKVWAKSNIGILPATNVSEDVGTVDYTTGIISITGINGRVVFNTVSVSCSMVEDDVMIDRSYLLQLENAEVVANAV
jgi:hypothetical protein